MKPKIKVLIGTKVNEGHTFVQKLNTIYDNKHFFSCNILNSACEPDGAIMNDERVEMNGSVSGTTENTHSLYFNTALCM